MRLLSSLLGSFIRNGTLHLVAADGSTHLFGGRAPGPEVEVRLHDAGLHRRLALNPELAAGEAYMDGTLTIGRGGSVHDLLLLFSVNREGLGAHASQKLLRRLWRTFRRRQQANAVAASARNARHHYDIGTDLYRLFLDEGLNYSCAFFEHPDHDTLEQAQAAKIQRILAKLRLEPGMTVAEIGSGWGSLAIAMAEKGAKVVAINLARDQIEISRARSEAAGVARHIEFREQDYRSFSGQFDRVVSVGMMEHVGIGQFDAYFSTIRGLLAPRGYALVHCIGRMTPPGTTGPFIRKYIFPGGYVPALSEVFAATERIGLWVSDMEVLRMHYYHTIRHWRLRFAERRTEAQAMMDERFCRMWEFYLSAVELGFLHGSNMVFQILLSTERDAVPIVREFMSSQLRSSQLRSSQLRSSQ